MLDWVVRSFEMLPDSFLDPFYVGAAFIALYQNNKFRKLTPADPVIQRFVAPLIGARARDFSGRFAYWLSLTLCLSITLLIYYFLCQISPNVLVGAAKAFSGDTNAGDALGDIPYPIYVAVILLSVQNVPGFSELELVDALRAFFHKQIGIPTRVVEYANNASQTILRRCGSDKDKLICEIRRLIENPLRSELERYSDKLFPAAQFDRMNLAYHDMSVQTLADSSMKELRGLLEQVVISWLVGAMRKSGPKALDTISGLITGTPVYAPFRVGSFLKSSLASSIILLAGLPAIAFLLNQLAQPVSRILGTIPEEDLWPNDLTNVVREILSIVSYLFVCLLAAIYLWSRRSVTRANDGMSSGDKRISFDYFVELGRSAAPILVWCFLIFIGINIIQTFYNYGVFNIPPSGEIAPLTKMFLFSVKSLIVISLCYITIIYIDSYAQARSLRYFSISLLVIIIAVGVFSFLYDFTFLHLDYFGEYPKVAPGWEHVLFSVIANVLISICAFAAVVVFFKPPNLLPGRVPQLI